jgi:pilus assembly protein CpaF
MLELLKLAVICRFNILVSGGTGSGKTTLLNVLSDFIPATDRVLTVEDTRELQIENENHIPFEAPTRRKKADSQNVDLAFLIKTCLRKNPTRIIVGEIRDAKAANAFLQAINTGHSACSTIHANGPEDALIRIQTLVAGQGDLPFDVVKAQVRANLNIIIHTESTPNHGRRIVSVTEIIEGQPSELWCWSYRQGIHTRTDVQSGIYQRLEKFAIDIPN